MNPNLRGPSLDTALKMGLSNEALIYGIGLLPPKVRPIAGLLATILRLQPVLGNAKLGARTPAFMPLYSTRF